MEELELNLALELAAPVMDEVGVPVQEYVMETAARFASWFATGVAGTAYAVKSAAALGPNRTFKKSTIQQLGGAIARSGVHVENLRATAASQLQTLLPIDELRKTLVAGKTMSTAEKARTWNEISSLRFTHAVIWPILHAVLADTLAVESTVALLLQAKANIKATGEAGAVQGFLMARLMSMNGGGGFGGMMSTSKPGLHLISSLQEICELCRGEVLAALGPNFRCSDRLSVAALTRTLQVAFHKSLQSIVKMLERLLLSRRPREEECLGDEVESDEILSDVLRSHAFKQLLSNSAQSIFEGFVVAVLPQVCKQCQGFDPSKEEAPVVQIATQLGDAIHKMSSEVPPLNALVHQFCSSLLRANL